MDAVLITPSHSQETPIVQHHLLEKILSGDKLKQDDVVRLVQEKHTIPLWNSSCQLGNGSMVRMKGFVQDMFDAEYYMHSDNLSERTPLLITPIPYTSEWFRHAVNEDSSQKGKRQRTMNEEKSSVWWPQGTLQSDPEQLPLLAKFYYDHYENSTKLLLNDVVEIIGVLEYAQDDEMVEGFMDAVAPTDIARLHVIVYQKTSIHELVSPSSTIESSVSANAPLWLSRALSVSEVAGMALWTALFSRAEREFDGTSWLPKKTPQGSTVGTTSLNLILPDPQACSVMKESLFQVLSALVPVVVTLDVDRQSLEIRPPSKLDGRLTPSPLQLCKGAVLLLDVSKLDAGKLSSSQTETIQALQMLTSTHSIPYLFDGGVRLSFEADVSIIVLSTSTHKRLLPCEFEVKLDSSTESAPLQPEHYVAMRNALAIGRGNDNTSNIDLTKSLLETAESEFLSRRSKARDAEQDLPGELDFHRWLTLTRIIARSRGATSASVEDWTKALQLDDSFRATLFS